MKVGVVSGFIPLPVKHLSALQYYALGDKLMRACLGVDRFVGGGELDRCWAYALCTGLPPANPPPADRYETQDINVMSHIVQHQRTTWALQAAKVHPDVDVWVWFDYGLLKQGFWKNNPITEYIVKRFLERLAATPKLDVIPFPGIADKAQVFPTGNNWRFCGSTHIWPKQFLPDIDAAYKTTLQKWIANYAAVPLDLPIWALVEQNSGLPFRWYPAEYDATQLENYHDPAL
jgi:hypothetical protein